MTDRPCSTCAHYLPRDHPHQDRGGRTYAVDCCVHERVRNAHGVLAISLARRHDERCGPDGAFWTARAGVNNARKRP